MKGFLRFAGAIQIIAYIVGIILLAINIPLKDIGIFYFIMYIAFVPFIPFVCFAIAEILDHKEAQLDKLNNINKNVSLLANNPSKGSSLDANTNDKIVFKSLTSLTTEEKKQYKVEIQSLYNQFPFHRYATKVKDRMIDVRNEALESINASNTKEEAEKVVQAFKDALDELK